MEISFKRNYLSAIKNSKDCRLFSDFWAREKKGKLENITQGGRLSCAFFVSGLLKIFDLIKRFHLTVSSTIKDLKNSGWYEIPRPRKGAVLVWEEKDGHYHIGFYLGNKQALSNSSKKRKPIIHHYTFNGKRKIVAIFWHNKLN